MTMKLFHIQSSTENKKQTNSSKNVDLLTKILYLMYYKLNVLIMNIKQIQTMVEQQ